MWYMSGVFAALTAAAFSSKAEGETGEYEASVPDAGRAVGAGAQRHEGRDTRFRQKTVYWVVPTGKFAIVMADGDRMIGTLDRDWKASIKSEFGDVSIPRSKITKISATARGNVVISLVNGDRVSGALNSPLLRLTTPYGDISVPVAEMRLLSSTQVPIGSVTVFDENAQSKKDAGRPVAQPPVVSEEGGEF